MDSKNLYFESATHSTKKTNSLWFKAAIFFFSAFFSIQSNVLAQNPDLLYGVTASGGNDDAGVIFHIDRTTSVQIVDYANTVLIPGSTPYGELADGGNGKFYGMTSGGGANNMGEIFEWDTVSNIFTKKIDFNGNNYGASPHGSLSFANGKFYGMTSQGGTFGFGIIFEWDPVSNFITKKIDFDGSSKGKGPLSSLTLKDGKFYGVTFNGGINDNGVIFEWDPLTNIYLKKFDFESATSGKLPQGSMTVYNGKFYGMTSKGGSSDAGVIYEWDPLTNIFIKKFDFNMVNTGDSPVGSLTSYNNKLYGMTLHGGATPNGYGAIFEWDPISNDFMKMYNLGYDGECPHGSLSLLNGQFYGTTSQGGLHNCGNIFKWDPINNIYTNMINLDSVPNGIPYGSFTLSNGKFFGMCYSGGANNKGTIFKWDPTTNIFLKAIDFYYAPSGSKSYGSLLLSGGKFYGLTHTGGLYGNGAIFAWDPLSNTYTKKIDFNGLATGSHPSGTLVSFNGKFYGLTTFGGINDEGIIFEWDPVTNLFFKKVDFDLWTKGALPKGSMTLFNEKFYGMTWVGGSLDNGVIFEWDPITNIYSKKIEFDGINGHYPSGDLTLFGGKFYGMTEWGGTNESGVLFEWDPVTNILIKKLDFIGVENGADPFGSLTFRRGKFYGMTYLGGVNNKGIIFEYDPATNLLLKKIDFESNSNGRNPYNDLTLCSEKFYGLTYKGGVNNFGVMFEWNPDDNSFSKLLDFNSFNGRYPMYTHLVVFRDSTTAAQATNIYFTGIQNTQMNINWVDGTGEKRAVFIKQGSDGTASPLNNFTYVADTVFGSGTQIGTTGWYCIFNGTAHNTGVIVSNLISNTPYRVMVCEYTGAPGFEHYNDSTAEGNPANQTIGTYFTVGTTSNPTAGGTTTGSGSYISGSQATVTATPNTGYSFINWTENSNVVSTSVGYTFVVTANSNVVANFTPQQYIISISSAPVAGGTTSGGGSYNFGSTTTVTATANSTWTFLNWTENVNVVSTTSAYSFTVTANRALVANFTQDPTFLVTTASEPVSGGTTSGGGNYYSGQPATVTATANTGYNFTTWTENGTVVSVAANYTFTISGARNLVANFTMQQFNITTSSNPPTAGTTSGDGTFNYGTQTMVTAIPNSNWNFLSWTEDGVIVSISPAYTFYVYSDRALVANFASAPSYQITTVSSPVAGGETSGGGSFYIGQLATVTATANIGYDFSNWTENGTIVSTEANYSFTVAGARYLVANFTAQQFDVTTAANPAAGGIASGGGTYAFGDQVTIVATANSNWTFLNWTENGTIVSTSAEYTFIVAGDQDFTANFTQLPAYQVTTSSSPADGGITSGGGNYIAGQMATVTAISNTGYSFTDWTENGNVVSTDSVYSFAVTANTTLVANFDPADFMVSATAIPAGSGSISGGGIYSYGSTATLTASSGKSWEFYEWTENCNPVSANAIYSFVVTSARDLAAVFYQPGIQFVTSTIPQPIEGGYVTGCGTYYIDSVATVHAVPYSGWEFVSWTESGIPVSANPTFAYTVSDHRSLTADFRLYTGIAAPETNLIRVFPNPTKDKLYVEWDIAKKPQFDEVYLYNTLSQLVYRQNTEGITGRLMIDVKGFTPGIYYLVVSMKSVKVDDYKVVVKP